MGQSTISWRVWLGTRMAATFIGLLIVYAIIAHRPEIVHQEPPAIEAVRLALQQEPQKLLETQASPKAVPKSDPPPKPTPTIGADPNTTLPKLSPFISPSRASQPNSEIKVPIPPVPKTQTPGSAFTTSTPVAIAKAGDVASAQRGEGRQGNAPAGTLAPSTLALLRARECARIDARNRPANCPPNDELMRLLAKERGPKYRPENADGFSGNEQAWRGVPPPCLEDGDNFSASAERVCVRFGNIPSRVRTVREICEARGLGGCVDAPNQAVINAAAAQARQQQSAKQKAP